MTSTKKVGFLTFTFFVIILLVKADQVSGLTCFSCYSINGSDARCDDPNIRVYPGIIDPEECILPIPEEENITVKGEKGPAYEVAKSLKPEKPWTVRAPYCVKIIGTTGL